MTEAWTWATRPRRATTALLQVTDDKHVQVFDYLLDAIQRQIPPGDYPPDHPEVALAAAAAVDADKIAERPTNMVVTSWLKRHRSGLIVPRRTTGS